MMILHNKDEQIKNNDILFFWKSVSKCSQKNVGFNNYNIDFHINEFTLMD
uniref:Uncharacterized protein n=1 Tax=Meloidogyne enterolobii TaxID=390850 RepID=A0A6V7USW5_MELEN|nr:unnamed protein product [Meloidogyne enterolobii]